MTPSELLETFTTDEKEEERVAFKPNPGPQTSFLAASEPQVLYGGAAGGITKTRLLPPFRSNPIKINFVNCWKLFIPVCTTT
jgi:hypothetical protein